MHDQVPLPRSSPPIDGGRATVRTAVLVTPRLWHGSVGWDQTRGTRAAGRRAPAHHRQKGGGCQAPEIEILAWRVGGATVLRRTATLLTRRGVRRLIVVSASDARPIGLGQSRLDGQKRRRVGPDPGHPRSGSAGAGPPSIEGLEIEYVHDSGDEPVLETLARAIGPDRDLEFLLLPAHLVWSADGFERLLANSSRAEPGGIVVAEMASGDDPVAPCGAWRSSAIVLDTLREWTAQQPERSLADFLANLRERGSVVSRDIRPAWFESIEDRGDLERAERRLFADCRKPIDGPGDRYVNRYLSLALSRRLKDLPVTPNMISGVTFVVGLAAAWAATHATYLAFLAAALLMQLNSVLDCVDGELARVRLQQSRLGQWLDTLSDDCSNLLFFGGLAWGAAQLPAGRAFAISGIVACVGQLLMSAICYPELIATGSGDLLSLEWDFDSRPRGSAVNRLLSIARLAVKKDFFILAFVGLALCGVLPWALHFAAVGAVASVVAAGARLKHVRRRGPAANLQVSPL